MDILLICFLVSFGLGGALSLGLALRGQRAPARAGAVGCAAALTCFGGAGILARTLFALRGGVGLLAAALFSLLSTALFMGLTAWVRRLAQRQEALIALAGSLASVSATIAPGLLGRVVTVRREPALTLAASSPAAQPLPVGTTVVILGPCPRSRGLAVEVAPLPPEGN